MDIINRQAAIDVFEDTTYTKNEIRRRITELPSAQSEIVRCCKCSYWDRDSLRHRCNDFRDWNEAECKILAERDPYDEINRYTEADDYCSRAERKHDE